MIRYGMPALIELNTVAQTAELCRRLDLSFVELNTNFPQYQIHLLDAASLNRLRGELGIGFTLHLNDEMPVADFCPSVAHGYRAAVLDAIELAKRVEIPVLNMHVSEGGHYTTPERIVYFYEAFRREYLDGMARFRDICTEAIGQSGIRICMENSTTYHGFQKEALELLLESPAFDLTLDIGHSHCCGHADEEWILRHDRLRHMHIHDAAGGVHDHLPLGAGVLDLPKYLALAERHGCSAVLEVKTVAGLEQSVRWLRSHRWPAP